MDKFNANAVDLVSMQSIEMHSAFLTILRFYQSHGFVGFVFKDLAKFYPDAEINILASQVAFLVHDGYLNKRLSDDDDYAYYYISDILFHFFAQYLKEK